MANDVLVWVWCVVALGIGVLAFWVIGSSWRANHGRRLFASWLAALFGLLAAAWMVQMPALEGDAARQWTSWLMFSVAALAQGALIANIISAACAVVDDASIWRIMLLAAAVLLAAFLPLLFVAAATPVTILG